MAASFSARTPYAIFLNAAAIALCSLATASAGAQSAPADALPPASASTGGGTVPCAKPEWPKKSLRAGEQGAVTLTFLIDVDGKVAESRIVTSSGFPALDEAAQTGLAKCRFRPGLVNGKPEKAWVKIQYVWTIDRFPTVQALTAAEASRNRQAAERGDAESQFLTGYAHRSGKGQARDDVQAARWYLKAAAQEHVLAQFNLGLMYLAGTGVTKNEIEGAAWTRKAAEQGHATAQFNLAAMYTRGQGVGQSDSEAAAWMRKAADQGMASAQVQLGDMYEEGRGVTQDGVQAAAWYGKAAEQGNASAQYYLAQCYENGIGVAQDLKAALGWYAKAAAQGHRAAAAALVAPRS